MGCRESTRLGSRGGRGMGGGSGMVWIGLVQRLGSLIDIGIERALCGGVVEVSNPPDASEARCHVPKAGNTSPTNTEEDFNCTVGLVDTL